MKIGMKCCTGDFGRLGRRTRSQKNLNKIDPADIYSWNLNMSFVNYHTFKHCCLSMGFLSTRIESYQITRSSSCFSEKGANYRESF